MQIKIKTDNPEYMPVRKTDGAACYDCFAAIGGQILKKIAPGATAIIPLGFSVEVPEGYYLEVRGRSGLASKGYLCATGTVDSDYRGEVGAIITNTTTEDFMIGDKFRIAQVMIKKVESFEFIPADELSKTLRGAGGFGSTGV